MKVLRSCFFTIAVVVVSGLLLLNSGCEVNETTQPNNYTILWKNDNGTVLESDGDVLAGTIPTYDGSTPTKSPDSMYTYTFSGWDIDPSAATEDKTYTATYTKSDRYYVVTIAVNNSNYGTVSSSSVNVACGTILSVDGNRITIGDQVVEATPAIDTLEFKYAFHSWRNGACTVEADLTVTALFAKMDLRENVCTYTYNNSTQSYIVSGATNVSTSTLIEAEYDDGINGEHAVTAIADGVFKNKTSLVSVIIPGTVTSIGYKSFEGCSSLETVVLSDDLMTIGRSAFSFCSSLDTITIPAGVTLIDDLAFYRCSSLDIITIPTGVESIGDRAFEDCSALTSVTIPNSVESIGNGAFAGCTALETVNYNATNLIDFSSLDNLVFYKAGRSSVGITLNVGSNVERIPECLFYPSNFSTDLPKITMVNFGVNSVCASIGEYAFSHCSFLEEITIPDSVTTIEAGAFFGCDYLETVYIDSSAIADALSANDACGYLVNYANTVYILEDLSVSNSSYLTSNFTINTSDVTGYIKYIRNE